MSIDTEVNRRKRYELRRSIRDYGYGIFILCFGIFLIVSDRFGTPFIDEPFPRYCLIGLFLVYGSFRIYRGYKKSYFKD